MNILITGCNGFIAKALVSYFTNKEHKILLTNRKNLDVRDQSKVDEFFCNNNIDFVIHTAVVGGKRNHIESVNDLFDNLIMYNNLYRNKHKFKMMINIGSGAEFDRRTDIDQASEAEVFNSNPIDYYGLSKNLITRKCYDSNNIYNLRLFGCFGIQEEEQRLIKSTFNSCISDLDLIVHQDKYMDFFYVKDFCKVVEFYIENHNSTLFRDVNLCYKTKETIKNIVFLIKDLTNSKNSVILSNNIFGHSYSGCAQNIQAYNLKLYGLTQGVEECLKNWKKY